VTSLTSDQDHIDFLNLPLFIAYFVADLESFSKHHNKVSFG